MNELIQPPKPINPNQISPFNLYQPVPSAFGENLTYIEFLMGLIKQFNAVIESQQSVYNYVNSINFSELTTNAVNGLVEDGTIAKIINEDLFTELDNKITGAQNEIVAIQAEIAAMKNVNNTFKVVMIGDSLGLGQTSSGYTNGWCKNVQTYMGLPDSRCIIKAQGGAGFGNGIFNQLVQSAIDDVNDKENVRYVIIGGGDNEINLTPTSIDSNMSSAISLLKTNFPNAKVILGYMAYNNNQTDDAWLKRSQLVSTVKNIYSGCTALGAEFVPNLNYVKHDATLVESDGIHLNENGYKTLARAFYNAILGTDGNGIYKPEHQTFLVYNQPSSITSSNLNQKLFTALNDSNVSIQITENVIISGNLTVNESGYYTLAESGSRLNFINPLILNPLQMEVEALVNGTLYPALLYFSFNGGVYLKIQGAFETYPVATSIGIFPAEKTLPIDFC